MALLAHLQGHTLGKASCYFPKLSLLLPMRAGTQTRLPRAVPIDGQIFKSSPEHCWNRITPACLSP